MSNWTIELSHPQWQLAHLEKALRAWLVFNQNLLGAVSIQVVEQLGNEVHIARALKI